MNPLDGKQSCLCELDNVIYQYVLLRFSLELPQLTVCYDNLIIT